MAKKKQTRKQQRDLMKKYGWIAPAEAADRAGVATVTIYYWLNTGKVKEKRVGRARYVGLKSLRAYMKSGVPQAI